MSKLRQWVKQVCLTIIYHIYPTPPLRQDMTQGQFFNFNLNRFEFRVFLLLD